MRIVTSRLAIKSCGVTVSPNLPCVINDFTAQDWCKVDKYCRVSTTKHLERPYFGQDLNGKKLWIWRGAGLGDLLVVTGILREIKRMFPTCSIHLGAFSGTTKLLGIDQPDGECKGLFDTVPPVIPLDLWKSYDWHKDLTEIVECDCEPVQTNIWETHFRVMNIPLPPPERQRPCNIATQKARAMALEWLIRHDCRRPVLLYQLSASSKIRSQSPAVVFQCLEKLVDAFPSLGIVAVGGKREESIATPQGVWRCVGEDALMLAGLAAAAVAIVCPDSCLNHIAAGLGDKSPAVVSLWSSFPPAERVSTYPRQFPIYHKTGDKPECAPCRRHEFASEYGCPLYGGNCKGLDSITPEEIIAQLRLALA